MMPVLGGHKEFGSSSLFAVDCAIVRFNGSFHSSEGFEYGDLNCESGMDGNYLNFYDAIKLAYLDIKIISNCDGSNQQLDHPADFYDYHIYSDSNSVFCLAHKFDHTSRSGPKAFVSEYAVTGKDAGIGSLLAALAEAGFLIGVERNSDIVEMSSYAPLFVNTNDRSFLQRVADSLVSLLKSGADRELEIIEQIFTSWSYIMIFAVFGPRYS
ncbi:Alpha-L-arabinofuranosidase 1 [Camellia lanceoleosa]|uniref:Alpha-L-arabinofuranosidase 1 n=1 Tax=Camellia lanceoleosa TaxID=1840588 RepID=A0ACC0J4W6_9ERIC|nr:Alpha-L-arabinofuranosidase 1 [Camellia lanceoleosa]